jgi:two-component system NtrC family sensor kinase
MPGIGSCLLLELDTREAFATLNLLRNQAVTVGMFLFVVLVLTSIFLTRGITRPIHRLVAAVQKTARGDIVKEVAVDSSDEMGLLAREFNVMAEKLQLSYADLENVVERRTRELKSAQDQLVQIGKLAAVGELAGGMAHEINNPTGIILTRVGYLLSELKDGRLPLEFEEDLRTLEIHARRIARITNGLLTFSRHSTFELKPVEIAEVVDGSIGIVEHRFRRHGVRLIRRVPPDLPLIVADANYLEQVFINLLNNAVDAVEDEGEVRVEIDRIADGNGKSSLEIRVSDNGSGIEPENLDKVFDPFFTTKEVGKGTGLGLSISYGIIQEHGGGIRVESGPEKGATFIITLPVERDED